MSEIEQGKTEEEADYFSYFIDQTNHGVVFDQDLSVLTELPLRLLTDVEKKARRKWNRTRQKLEDHYLQLSPPTIRSTSELLSERLVAPSLTTKDASTRSAPAKNRAGRRYPDKISPWEDFAPSLTTFAVPNQSLSGNPCSSFFLSLTSGRSTMTKRDERQEEIFLVDLLNSSLHANNLIGPIKSSGPVVGRPDIMTTSVRNEDEGGDSDDGEESVDSDDNETQEDVKVLAEFKSTHNLPLPMNATEVCEMYNSAYEAVYEQRNGRTDGWSRTCHPIGQLLGYMADNYKRFGILSSGTRSYFLRIRKSGDETEVVEISDAMFIGQANYLKAWVYIHHLAANDHAELLDQSKLAWNKTSKKSPTPPPKPKREQPHRSGKKSGGGQEDDPKVPDGKRRKCSGDAATTCVDVTLSLPFVSFSDLRILRRLGDGRNGTVFLADWNGTNVAVKQYDFAKSGIAYDTELKAYLKVKEAWGRLVPRPYFVSESWSGGVMFLGMQAGRRLEKSDNVSLEQWRQVLDSLEEDFGVRHEDCDRRNGILIPDEANHGHERLVAIDLEDVTFL